jgi:glycerol-3-phosphate responsive antiterminator
MDIFYLNIALYILMFCLIVYLYKKINKQKNEIDTLKENILKFEKALSIASASIIDEVGVNKDFEKFHSRASNFLFLVCSKLDNLKEVKNKTVGVFSRLFFSDYSNRKDIENSLLLLSSQCTEKVPGSMKSIITRIKNNKLLTYEVSLDTSKTFLFSVKYKNENMEEVIVKKLTIVEVIKLIYELPDIIKIKKKKLKQNFKSRDVYNQTVKGMSDYILEITNK